MQKFFNTLLCSWGSDTPPEVIWALNDLLEYAEGLGFKSTQYVCFEEVYESETAEENNMGLAKLLVDFFKERCKSG